MNRNIFYVCLFMNKIKTINTRVYARNIVIVAYIKN